MKNSDHEIGASIKLLEKNFEQLFDFVVAVVSRGMDFVKECNEFKIVFVVEDLIAFSFWIANGRDWFDFYTEGNLVFPLAEDQKDSIYAKITDFFGNDIFLGYRLLKDEKLEI